MQDVMTLSWSRAAVRVAAGTVSLIGFFGLVVLAVQADAAASWANPWLTALDVFVGLAFVAVAAAARTRLVQCGLVAGVGVAWLIGSSVAAGRPLHQGVLAVALIAFPRGRIRGPAAWLLAAAAVLVGSGSVGQLGTAVCFASVALHALVRGRPGSAAVWYPTVAGSSIAAVLAVLWAGDQARQGWIDPRDGLLIYQAVLLMVAVAFLPAVRAVNRAHSGLADHMLPGGDPDGLDGLATVLGAALGDPALRIYAWDEARSAYVDGQGRPVQVDEEGRHWLRVAETDHPVAVVGHRSADLDDPATAAAVGTAVRLAATHLSLQGQLRQQLRELEASRARLVSTGDRAREAVAAELRGEVADPLRQVEAELRALLPRAREDQAAALEVVVGELATAVGELSALAVGAPLAPLGDGRLRTALEGLARSCPVPTSIIDRGTASDPVVETTLFYVCAEALANATKHARASRVTITLQRSGRDVVASVIDDGIGGADPDGSGLLGLADRLAAHGGRLRVESPPGAGTTVTAMVPDQPILLHGSSTSS